MTQKLKYNKEPHGDHEYLLEFIDHTFSGIKFILGKVQLLEENDNCTLKYHYDIIENNTEHSIKHDVKQSFEQTVGDLVMQMIDDGLENENLIYYGGVDENRTDNTKQSST